MLFPNKTARLTYRETAAFRELSGAFLTPAPWVQPTSQDSLYFATLPLLPMSESQKRGRGTLGRHVGHLPGATARGSGNPSGPRRVPRELRAGGQGPGGATWGPAPSPRLRFLEAGTRMPAARGRGGPSAKTKVTFLATVLGLLTGVSAGALHEVTEGALNLGSETGL